MFIRFVASTSPNAKVPITRLWKVTPLKKWKNFWYEAQCKILRCIIIEFQF